MNQTHIDYVSKILYPYFKHPQDREDATQEALLNAHRYRDRFDGESKYSTWLHSVAVRTALSIIRKASRPKHQADFVEFNDELDSYENSLSARMELNEVYQIVGDNKVFWLYVRDGMSDGEIARYTGLNINTVRSRIRRARSAING